MREDWDKRKIGEICEVLNGFAFKSSEYVENGIRVIRITNVQKGYVVDDDPKYYPMTASESIKSYFLNSGDLLMSLTGNVGRVGVLQEEMLPAALNQRVACLRIKDKRVLLKYLFHNLNSPIFEQDCINSASGVAQKNMSTEWLKKYVIGIPPIAEQEKIIAELDCLTGVIEKKKQQLDNLDKLAQSIFYDMFGDPITNEKSWKVEKLGEVVRDNYVGLVRSAKEQGDDKEFLYFKMNNISADGYVDLSKTTRIDATEAEKKKYELHYGDFLFNTRNSYELVGKSCVFNVQSNYPILLNNNILRLTFNDSLDPFFLSSLFKDRLMKEQLNEIKKGTTNVCAIYYKDLARTRIIIPDIQEQRAFRERLEVIEKQKELVKRSIVETETLFNSRMDYWFN